MEKQVMRFVGAQLSALRLIFLSHLAVSDAQMQRTSGTETSFLVRSGYVRKKSSALQTKDDAGANQRFEIPTHQILHEIIFLTNPNT
jgi:hypothetical protein